MRWTLSLPFAPATALAKAARGCALVATLLLTPLDVGAETSTPNPLLPITTFSVGEGLPSALVYQLVQDASGRIWILTRVGIVSYDGASFETQGAKQGIDTTVWGALTVDDRGQVLAVGLSGRIFRNEGETWRLLAPAIGQTFKGRVQSLAQATQNGQENILAGTSDGLWLWNGRAWSRLDGTQPLDKINAVARAGQTLFVGTDSGLFRVVDGVLDRSPNKDPRLHERILALNSGAVDGRDSLLLLSRHWLGALAEERLTMFGQRLDFDLAARFDPHESSALTTSAINIDSTGVVFFGTMYRAYRLEPGESSPSELGPAQGLLGEGGVTSILADREGAVWIGSLRGLARVGSSRFRSLNKKSGLAENEVTAIAELPGGRFLLGHNASLTYMDSEGRRVLEAFKVPELSNELSNGVPRVLDLAVERSGTVWAAASVGLLEIGRDRRISMHTFPERVVSVELDPQGRLFVLCPKTLYMKRGARFEKLPVVLPDGWRFGGARWLGTDGGDHLYIGTAAGLLSRDGLNAAAFVPDVPWRRARSADQRGDNVYAMMAMGSGDLMVGTAGGLYRLAGNNLIEATGTLALSRPVYFLLQDRSNQLWAGTDNGVVVAEREGFRLLSIRHGLAGRETNRGAAAIDRSGRIWIGTDQGLSIYREKLDSRLTVPPPVEIHGVDIDGERYGSNATLNLPSSPRSLVFHATLLSFSNEEQALCRYRLEGLSEDWQRPAPLTSSGVRYTSLPPGRYRLRIAAAWHPRGPWGPESASPEISIATPFWARPWVWALTLLIAGSALFSAYRFRLNQLGMRNAQLESFNDKLRESAGERQRLISQLEIKNAELERFTYTVSHDLKAPLVTIRGFTSFVEKDVAEGRLDQVPTDIQRIRKASETMALLLDQLLELSRIGRVVGASESLPLTSLLFDAAQRVPNMASAELVIQPDLPLIAGDRTRLLQVFENLLGNALKFSRAQAHPRIEVSLRSGAESVIVVSDNGMGIDPRFHQKVFDLFERLDKKTEGTGIGLAIVQRIVEVYGGRIWIESDGTPGEGSRFCLTLPKAFADAPPDQPAL